HLQHLWRAVTSGAETNGPGSVVAQIDRRIGRPPAAREGRLGTAFLLQGGKGELDVLAGAEVVGRVVRAGTKILPGQYAPYCYAIARLRLRVDDAEVGKERVGADILQRERLFSPELATQDALPINRWQVSRRVGTRDLRLLGEPLGRPGGIGLS